jgi:hypothetical protein
MNRTLRFAVGGLLLVACGGGTSSGGSSGSGSGGCEPPDCHMNPGPCESMPNQPGCPGYVPPEGEGEGAGEADTTMEAEAPPQGVPLPE